MELMVSSLGPGVDRFGVLDIKSVLVDIQDVRKYFVVRSGFLSGRSAVVKAVDGVSLRIMRGETLGLVGESGCGKSTLGRIIMRLEELTSGRIFFDGRDISSYSGSSLKEYRKRIQIIFQDPYASLNPRRSAGDTIAEPLLIYGVKNREERESELNRVMQLVGLTPDQKDRYPHEFSGGQRQRIGIARAIILRPELIIADEPVSSLDVSIQAQILNLLKDLQKELNLTYLFISHDLNVVKHISDRIAVMYLGKIVELSSKKELFERPLHPYTMALLSAVPTRNPNEKRRQGALFTGERPGPTNIPPGCTFHPRCPFRMEMCDRVAPELAEKTKHHFVACHMVARG